MLPNHRFSKTVCVYKITYTIVWHFLESIFFIANIYKRFFSLFQQVGDPSSLPPNYFANNLLAALVLSTDSETEGFLCDNCDAGDPAETRCKECEIFICHFCSEYHRRSHATKSHVLVSISDLTSSEPSALARRLQCEKHKEEMNLYCQTCEMTICRECIIADHREHKYSKIQDVSLEEKNNFQKVLDNAKVRKDRIASGIYDVQIRAERVKAKQESTIEEVRNFFEGLTVMIENRKEELVARANASTASKLEQLRRQSNRLKDTLDTYESSIDFVQQAFQSGSDAQILNMKKFISRRLNKLQFLYSQTQPCVDEYMKFRNNLSVKDIEVDIKRVPNYFAKLQNILYPQNSRKTTKKWKIPFLPWKKRFYPNRYSHKITVYKSSNLFYIANIYNTIFKSAILHNATIEMIAGCQNFCLPYTLKLAKSLKIRSFKW